MWSRQVKAHWCGCASNYVSCTIKCVRGLYTVDRCVGCTMHALAPCCGPCILMFSVLYILLPVLSHHQLPSTPSPTLTKWGPHPCPTSRVFDCSYTCLWFWPPGCGVQRISWGEAVGACGAVAAGAAASAQLHMPTVAVHVCNTTACTLCEAMSLWVACTAGVCTDTWQGSAACDHDLRGLCATSTPRVTAYEDGQNDLPATGSAPARGQPTGAQHSTQHVHQGPRTRCVCRAGTWPHPIRASVYWGGASVYWGESGVNCLLGEFGVNAHSQT